jgi:hypothetical protein
VVLFNALNSNNLCVCVIQQKSIRVIRLNYKINFIGKRLSEHTEFLSIYDFVGNEFKLCVLVQI